jgi:DNA mismatch repair ATPase MutS
MEKAMSKKQDILVSDFKNMHVPDLQSTLQSILDTPYFSRRVASEAETRKRFLTLAREIGCDREMLMLFAKADKAMKSCQNEQERKDMGKYFCVEAYNLLGGNGELVVDGQLVCKG